MKTILDTNVLVRFLIGDKNKKFTGVFSFFRSVEQGDMHVELKIIVLFQTIFVLKSFYKVPKDEIAEAMKKILSFKGIIAKEKKIMIRALDVWHASKIEIVDAYLIACLEKDSQNILYSYDKDFDKFNINRKEP